MDIRKIFESISLELSARFLKTTQIKHNGGKGDNREAAFTEFLREYLPGKYGIGRGEVISPENEISKELDVVIFDNNHCPLFFNSYSHSLYPRESVFGAISMKSHLNSEELKDAYSNIVSLKEISSKKGFQATQTIGMSVGLNPVVPVTAIFAYAADRSLESIAKQVKLLDSQLDDIKLRPDFVVVLGLGIIGPDARIRRVGNYYDLPEDHSKLSFMRKTGRHTLLRFYMQLLNELNTIHQPNLDLDKYLNMPSKIGVYKVRNNKGLIVRLDGETDNSVKRLNASAIRKIVEGSRKVTLKQHFINVFGGLPEGAESKYNLNTDVYEYNPFNKSCLKPYQDQSGEYINNNAFQVLTIEIDNKNYAVDIYSLTVNDFEDNPDFTVDELMSS